MVDISKEVIGLNDSRYSLKTVDRLVSMYTLCVEYYDSMGDPIKYYFVDKIHSIFAADRTLEKIVRKTDSSPPQDDLRSKVEEMDLQQERRS
jgi:hypothetical protein